jgi:hypothetical protein
MRAVVRFGAVLTTAGALAAVGLALGAVGGESV